MDTSAVTTSENEEKSMKSGFELWLRDMLPFLKTLYIKLRIGPESRSYNMWFKVVGRSDNAYVIYNPNYFRGHGKKEQVLLYLNDPRIIDQKWSNDHCLLTPPQEYERFLEGCRRSNYYPDDFVVKYSLHIRRR